MAGKKKLINYIIDIAILIAFVLLMINGILMQIIYHMNHNDPNYVFLWFNKNGWLLLHKILSVLAFTGITAHVFLHFNWIKDVFINKRLFSKNFKNKALAFLFITFYFSGFLTFVSWAFNNRITGYNYELRHFILEIHDKITILLIILFAIHFVKKLKWLLKATRQLFMSNEK
jgi:hypothetical protein